MKQETASILFFLGSRSLKNGEYPIYLRITINGQNDQTAIKRTIEKKLWNQSKGCSKGRDRNSMELNDYIAQLRSGVNDIHKELILTEAFISPNAILAQLFQTKEKRTVLSTMKKEIDRMESLIGIDYEYITINRYKNCYRSVEAVIKEHYKKEEITFHELTNEFVRDLEDYLKITKNLKQSTLVRYMKCFKKITNMAFNNGWMRINPFAGMQFRQPKSNPVFLTKDELSAIENVELNSENIKIARDLFVFCCYTGLAFIDAKELCNKDIIKDNNGKFWIRKDRHKLKKDKGRCIANVPLLKKPLNILEKYKNHPKCIKQGVSIPLFCNQTMNNYLKTIASLAGIEKKLSTHVARHTFATTVTLANKVSLQNVAKMLGHTSTRMTEHYARVMDQSIIEDMEQVSKRLA